MTREEAIKQLKKWPLPKETMELLEALSPGLTNEFRESEDERIRKYIAKIMEDLLWLGDEPFTKEQVLTYLEKQKEQTWIPTDEQRTALGMVLKHSDPDADSTKVLESLLDELTKISNPKVAKWKEKQKEQKPVDRFEEAREKYQVEWSDEDERMLKSTIWHISNSLTNGKNTDCKCDLTEWLKEKLKSLRPVKREWSEEDEHRRKDAIYFLESAKKHYADTSEIEKTIAWLKSLPMKCPKSSDIWKPSEEQMEALESAVKLYKDTHFEIHHEKIVSLYEQLKKLM